MNFSFETILGIIFFIVFFVLPALNRKKPDKDEAGPEAPAEPADGRTQEGPAQARPATDAPAGQPRTRPAQASTDQQGSPAPRASTSRGGGPLTAGSIEEALEEIRARVRDAQQQEESQRGSTSARRSSSQSSAPRKGRTVKSDTGGGGLVSGEARRKGETGSGPGRSVAGRERAAASGARPTPDQAARSTRGADSVAEPLEVVRRSRDKARRARQEVSDPTGQPGTAQDGLPRGGGGAARLGAPGVPGARALATDRRSLVTGMIWHEILSEPAAKRRLRRTRSLHQ